MKRYISPRGVDANAVVAIAKEIVLECLEAELESGWDIEAAVIKAVYEIGRLLLSALFSTCCYLDALEYLESKGIARADIRFRLERGYFSTVNTSLGVVVFARFAFRTRLGGTRTPTPSCLPALKKVRSTMVLLQLEAALGSRLPFRQAEEFLSLVTHGNVSIHDSTIAAHCKVIASVMRREWLYRRVPEIQEILVTRAIRDAETNRPLVFFSSDGQYMSNQPRLDGIGI